MHHKRLDIQGLRALAVLLVIGNHLLVWPAGGFVGVDVFFVISGFLITDLLLRERNESGQISLGKFYKRRLRRVVPAAATVLILTTLGAWLLFTPVRAASVVRDAIWAAVFSVNWHFVIDGTNYMQATSPVSPLQHYWSLAIEEQFYIIWPFLILVILGAVAAVTAKRVGLLLLVIGAITIASFVWALYDTATSPPSAYFSTFSRAWELGVGAILAVTASLLARIPLRTRPFLAWAGLVGITASAFFFTSATPFPGPWAFVPVTSTALVIIAGIGGNPRFLLPITNPAASYLGDISYSLYLWHFPIIIFSSVFFVAGGRKQIIVAVAATALFSVTSYHFLESPIRRSSWLAKERRLRAPLPTKSRIAIGGVGAITILMVVLAFATPGGTPADQAREQAREQARLAAKSLYPIISTGPASNALQVSIARALSTKSWPKLAPLSMAPEWVKDGCLGSDVNNVGTPEQNSLRCVYGAQTATRTAVVLGDSTAISYLPGIRAALEPAGYKILDFTLAQCPAISTSVLTMQNLPYPQCNQYHSWAIGEINRLRPDLVIMTSESATIDRLASKLRGNAARAEWTARTEITLADIGDSAKKVVILDPPPTGYDLVECAGETTTPSDCIGSAGTAYPIVRSATIAAIAKTKVSASILYPDTRNWTCDSKGECPSFIDGAPVFADGLHLSAAFAAKLGPVIAEVILGKSRHQK